MRGPVLVGAAQALAGLVAAGTGGAPITDVPKSVHLSDLVRTLMSEGVHPSKIRAELASQGVRWAYGFSNSVEGARQSVQGVRERERRRRAARLCLNACGNTYPSGRTSETCDDCLRAKWGGTNGPHVPQEYR